MRAFRRTAVFAILPLLLVGALAASDPAQPEQAPPLLHPLFKTTRCCNAIVRSRYMATRSPTPPLHLFEVPTFLVGPRRPDPHPRWGENRGSADFATFPCISHRRIGIRPTAQ